MVNEQHFGVIYMHSSLYPRQRGHLNRIYTGQGPFESGQNRLVLKPRWAIGYWLAHGCNPIWSTTNQVWVRLL